MTKLQRFTNYLASLVAAAGISFVLFHAASTLAGFFFHSGPAGAAGVQTFFVGTTTGSANAYAIATTPSIGWSLTPGFTIRAIASFTNTTTATLNVNSGSALPIVTNTQSGLVQLSGGEINSGNIYDLTYSTSAATSCGSSCYVLSWQAGTPIIVSSNPTVTAAQWISTAVFDVTTASQTITLPSSTTVSPNGAIFINTIGQQVVVAPNAADAINGGATGASITIPSGVFAMVTTPAANVISIAPLQGSVNVQAGTTYTLAASDCGKTLLFTSNSAITVTLAASVAPAAGAACVANFIQGGTAKVSLNGTAVSAATLISSHAFTGTTGAQGSTVGITLTTVSATATAYLTGDGS